MDGAKEIAAGGSTAGPADGQIQQMLELIALGGPVVTILLAMSVIALAIIILKLVQFRSVRLGQRRFAGDALARYRDGNTRDALAILARSRNPTARVMEVAIRGKSRRGVAEETVREEVARVAAMHLDNLRSHLRALEVIASLSPLLGLFGTVLGMIDVFQGMQAAGSQVSPSVLSGGIWEALLTTAVGLAVAIPVVAVVNWLAGAVDGLAADMESAVTQLFTLELSMMEGSREYPRAGLAQTAP